MKIDNVSSKTLILLIFFNLPQQALSQTPSELASLSLHDLMGLNIYDDASDTAAKTGSRWNVGYGYQRLRLDGYRTGTSNLSDQAVIFKPLEEPRTAKNYPVLPTTITQEIHTFNLNYQLNDDFQIGITAPYILQGTDHNSSIPNFDTFTIKNEGVGDVSLNVRYQLPSPYWKLSVALSLPTGSIKERGDTPRNGAGTKEQLPYTMQLGSGTYDLPLSIQYTDRDDNFHYGMQANALIRVGKNSESYRLGNTYGINSWVRWMTEYGLHPGISLGYRHSEKIHGMDSSLTVPGAFPYPANITDPNNYGGDKVDLGFSVKVCSKATNCKYFVELNMSKAVYQNLNGIQIKENFKFGFMTGINF
ncbi:MAG: hypothetical protein KBT53_03565 [Porticoccus sp.]|nr:hypothetical protein [Porticoccus sp.]MBQ0806399.1 hypothetical protein [Porticoccus sp.]